MEPTSTRVMQNEEASAEPSSNLSADLEVSAFTEELAASRRRSSFRARLLALVAFTAFELLCTLPFAIVSCIGQRRTAASQVMCVLASFSRLFFIHALFERFKSVSEGEPSIEELMDKLNEARAVWPGQLITIPGVSLLLVGLYAATCAVLTTGQATSDLWEVFQGLNIVICSGFLLANAVVALEAWLDSRQSARVGCKDIFPELLSTLPAKYETLSYSMEIQGGDSTMRTTCAICLDDFVVGDEVGKTPCDHIFHAACLKTWLRKAGGCPLRCAPLSPAHRGSHRSGREQPASEQHRPDQSAVDEAEATVLEPAVDQAEANVVESV